MSFFHRIFSDDKALYDLERLRKLEESLDGLSRAMRGLEQEWSDTLHRLNRMMGRIAKQADKLHEEEVAFEQATGDDGVGSVRRAPNRVPSGRGSAPLSEAQRAAQAEVIRRRMGGGA